MSVGFLGRAIAYVGIILGLLAIGLPLISDGDLTTRYLDDGTTFAFLILALSYASYLPAEIGRDLPAAAVGAAAFGFYLWYPAYLAFDRLGLLGAGGWLGICTVLIPIGWLIVRSAEPGGEGMQRRTAPSRRPSVRPPWERFSSSSGSGFPPTAMTATPAPGTCR